MAARMVLAAAVLAAAFSSPATANPAAEALIAERNCAACHGPGGVSPVPLMPSLAGQQADFLALQMILFREGLRQVPAMMEPARGLSDQQILDIAAWFAAQPSAPKPDRGPRDEALARRGAELSAARNCNACHLPDYSGRANVPRINHQREDFLVHTLAEYRDGLRVGADTQMNGLMHGLTNADIRAIAHYLAHHE
ncbi:c-type cytochrome [Rubritepida flocculans]|uniref:c-type cytochrome n=1 Tax=Rubritepida flocculans TaxID=182403 RepID=UPI00041332C9|nr:c-type cytochrome [Rubritepida flocculans]